MLKTSLKLLVTYFVVSVVQTSVCLAEPCSMSNTPQESSVIDLSGRYDLTTISPITASKFDIEVKQNGCESVEITEISRYDGKVISKKTFYLDKKIHEGFSSELYKPYSKADWYLQTGFVAVEFVSAPGGSECYREMEHDRFPAWRSTFVCNPFVRSSFIYDESYGEYVYEVKRGPGAVIPVFAHFKKL